MRGDSLSGGGLDVFEVWRGGGVTFWQGRGLGTVYALFRMRRDKSGGRNKELKFKV